MFVAVGTYARVLIAVELSGRLLFLWLRRESFFQEALIGKTAKGARLGALAFCLNDCRSLHPLLPVIAF